MLVGKRPAHLVGRDVAGNGADHFHRGDLAQRYLTMTVVRLQDSECGRHGEFTIAPRGVASADCTGTVTVGERVASWTQGFFKGTRMKLGPGIAAASMVTDMTALAAG